MFIRFLVVMVFHFLGLRLDSYLNPKEKFSQIYHFPYLFDLFNHHTFKYNDFDHYLPYFLLFLFLVLNTIQKQTEIVKKPKSSVFS